MAEKTDKQPKNASGPYYVDTQCIDCDVCRDMAPDHFARNDDDAYSYVFRQPATPAEVELCAEALQSCPVEAIGDDGA
jgi:ferredoxin